MFHYQLVLFPSFNNTTKNGGIKQIMSCGPVNAVQKLSSHAQVDRSLQQDARQRQGVPSQSSFRSQAPNATMEREFQMHQQQQQQFEPTFSNAFQGPVRMQQGPSRIQQKQPLSWANDFKMTMPLQQQQQQQQQQSSQWNSQFMNQMNLQQQHTHFSVAQRLGPQMQPNMAFNTRNMTEHRGLHDQYLNSQLEDLDHVELEREFDSLAKQFEKAEMEEPVPLDAELPNSNNAGFKQAAKQVADVMNSAQSEKFANSKFLDLMTKVSAGHVELNEDETKLVDGQGRDIHEEKLKDKAEPEKQTNRLPDPLKFVQDGDLETPFQSARLVGKSHGDSKYTWDDMYDDYRNDDTSF